jgi:hypothetical protein
MGIQKRNFGIVKRFLELPNTTDLPKSQNR